MTETVTSVGDPSSQEPTGGPGRRDYEIGDEIRVWSTWVPPEAGAEVARVLESGWLNTGPEERLFREEFGRRFRIAHCAACSSGTAALRASYAALGIGPGDEVITTPYTFIATNTAILEQGATPVFADIRYDTLDIDPESVAERITPRTRAIVCVHYGGIPCELDEIREVARAHDLPVIEDSAHALGSRYQGRYIGETGDLITFSLQAVKIVTSGDGGVIASPHAELAERARRLTWYGVDRDRKRTSLIDPLPDDLDRLGFKYNMNDITACLARCGLRHFDGPLGRRREIGERYRRELGDCRRIRLMRYPEHIEPNYQIFPIHVDDREGFAGFLAERGIQANVNNRRNDRYSIFGGVRDLPETARADEDVILIPMHAGLSDRHVDRIVEAVLDYDRS